MDNICRFISGDPAPDIIRALNFVYETKKLIGNEAKLSSVYRINLVTEGSAYYQCGSSRKELKKGDIFFIFPSVPYTLERIEGKEDIKYLYISFIGIRSNMLLQRLKIDCRNAVYEDFGNIEDFWWEGIETPEGLIDIAGESVLLYTLAKIGERAESLSEETSKGVNDEFLLVKKYIDDNFSDCGLSLDKLAKEFTYNKKYLSTAFKKHFKIGITEYVNTVRINHACVLMDRGYASVSNVAFLCGYDDPMYFSRVFKKTMKLSPREYMREKEQK